jgi:ferrous iron transport protein A
MHLPLSQLPRHTKARIVAIQDSEIQLQLMEMGFIPDEGILLEITAPLGDPLSIMIAGYNLSIRKQDADLISVEIIEG